MITASLKEAYSEFKNKYLTYVLPIIIAGILYVVMVPLGFIYLIVGACYAAILLPNFTKKYTVKDDMKGAWDYFVKWWYAFRKEDLSTRNSRGFIRYFGDDKVIAYIVTRGSNSLDKSLQPITCVIKTNDFEVLDWDDKPRYEKQVNPFIDISPVFIGAPSKSMRAEMEPSLRGGFQERKSKEKETESKQEPNDEVTE
jgi:hypothetical protein